MYTDSIFNYILGTCILQCLNFIIFKMRNLDLEKKLAPKLLICRKYRRVSQEKLAEKTEISEIYIGKIERGDANPTLEN